LWFPIWDTRSGHCHMSASCLFVLSLRCPAARPWPASFSLSPSRFDLFWIIRFQSPASLCNPQGGWLVPGVHRGQAGAAIHYHQPRVEPQPCRRPLSAAGGRFAGRGAQPAQRRQLSCGIRRAIWCLFWCLFVPGFHSLRCSIMQSLVIAYVLYINELCWFPRNCATPCNLAKNRLKIRRPQGRGGSSPPPGTMIR